MRKALLFLLSLFLAVAALAQQPQTQVNPLVPVNAKWSNGVAPGYWPKSSSGLNLTLTAGTVNCGLGVIVNYAGGTVALTNNTTNYVYLDATNSCVPTVTTGSFPPWSAIPIAVAVTSGGSVTIVTDVRTSTGMGVLPHNLLTDPGSNGIVKRTALTTTAPATANDVIGLWSGCSGTLLLGADGNCHANGGATSIGAAVGSGVSALGLAVDGSGNLAQPSQPLLVQFFPGVDLETKANACLVALPVNGGVCDARGFTGNQTIAGGASRIVVPAEDTLLLPDAYISCATAPCITWNQASHIIGNRGADSSSHTYGTTIFYSGKNYFVGTLAASPTGLVRTSNVVTATFSGVTNAPLIGQAMIVRNSISVGGTNFNNTFTVCGPPTSGCITPTSTSVTFTQTAANDTGGANVLVLSAVVISGGGQTAYTGTITGGLYTNGNPNALVGQYFTVAGFGQSANNGGPWRCTASTLTTLTLANPAGGTAESASATATVGEIHFPVAVMEAESNLPPSMQVAGVSATPAKAEVSNINIRQSFPPINHDGTIGFDLGLSYDAHIHDLFIGPLDYGFRTGGTSSGGYYNNVYNVFVSGSMSCGFWAARYSNANNLWGVHVDGGGLVGSIGICYEQNALKTTFHSPTIESTGTAIVVDGGANGIQEPYIEAAAGGVVFNPTAYADSYKGGVGTGITNNAPDLAQNPIWAPDAENAPYHFADQNYPSMFGSKFFKVLGGNTWLAPITAVSSGEYSGFHEIGETQASPSGLVRTSNIVTGTFNDVDVAPRIGEIITIHDSTSVGGTTFDGSFTICGPPTAGCITPAYNTVTWAQTASDDTGGGGTVRWFFSPFMYSFYLPSFNGANQQEFRTNPNNNSSATIFTADYSGSSVAWNAGLGGATNKGDFVLAQMTAPTATAVPTCVTCTATTSYRWVANSAAGSTTGGTVATLTGTAPADLNSSGAYTTIYAAGLPTGTVTLDIYRTATTGTCSSGSCTNGKIGTLSGSTLWNPTGLSFKDTGQVGDGGSVPGTNTTGQAKFGYTVAPMNGTNVVYRCTSDGTLPTGTLTTVSGSCGASVDTGLRVP